MVFLSAIVVLITLFAPFTVQVCHDELYQKTGCVKSERYNEYVGDYEWYERCNEFYKMSCYMVSNDLISKHASDVHRIEISLSNVGSLDSQLFVGFNNVESISMVGVNITMIEPDSFNSLRQLTELDLSNNSIKVVSEASLVSPRLHMADLSNNIISSVESNSFDHLNTLSMPYNKIENATNLTTNCYNLEKLDLSYNFITVMELADGCLNLLDLNVSHNEITIFTVISKTPLKLNRLYLSANKLHDITSKNFQNLNDLLTLDLSYNPIFYENNPATDLFQNTIELEHLNLSSTGMQKITIGTFTKLFKLLELDLSHNNLSYLPKGIFHDTKRLKNLYINDNRLATFRYQEIGSLAQIDLNDNVWICDKLSDLIGILVNKGVGVIHGHTRDVGNILGISCIDNVESHRTIEPHFQHSGNITKEGEEYLSLLQNLNLSMQQLILQQEERSKMLALTQQNESSAYWSRVNQDYKKFFQTVDHNVQEVIHKITNILNLAQNANSSKINDANFQILASNQLKSLATNFTKSIRNDSKSFLGEIKTIFESTSSRIQNKFEETVNSDRRNLTKEIRNIFDSSLSKIQANFQETVNADRKSFIEEIRNMFAPTLSIIQNNFLAINKLVKTNGLVYKQISNESDIILPKSSSLKSENENISYLNQNYQLLAIGVYGILLVLVVGIIFYFVTKAKSRRLFKPESSECNLLRSMPI